MLTVPIELHDSIAALAKAANKPKAAVIVEWLQESKPAIEQLTKVLHAVKNNPSGLQAMMEQQLGQAVLQLGNAGREFSEVVASLPVAPRVGKKRIRRK
jgi:hypothetical protein